MKPPGPCLGDVLDARAVLGLVELNLLWDSELPESLHGDRLREETTLLLTAPPETP